jgi:hypothetical protein
MKTLYEITHEEGTELLKATEMIRSKYFDAHGIKKAEDFMNDPLFIQFVEAIDKLVDFLKTNLEEEKETYILPSEHTRIIDTIIETGKQMQSLNKLAELREQVKGML